MWKSIQWLLITTERLVFRHRMRPEISTTIKCGETKEMDIIVENWSYPTYSPAYGVVIMFVRQRYLQALLRRLIYLRIPEYKASLAEIIHQHCVFAYWNFILPISQNGCRTLSYDMNCGSFDINEWKQPDASFWWRICIAIGVIVAGDTKAGYQQRLLLRTWVSRSKYRLDWLLSNIKIGRSSSQL